MANYLVTDTDLTAVADAIREKGGTSAGLEFPDGFVDAVEAIETGGGEDYLALAIGNQLTSYASDAVTSIRANMFNGASNLQQISLPNATSMGTTAFKGCTKLSSVYLPKLSTLSGNSQFDGAKVVVMVLPSITTQLSLAFLQNDTALTAVDLGPNSNGFAGTCFFGAANLTTVILRKSTAITAMGSTQSFGSTPFKSGGSGGTIYIPKALYDHLGDGSSLDYKAATNWSTVDGYGTITWAPIEASIYETQYADGTPIT